MIKLFFIFFLETKNFFTTDDRDYATRYYAGFLVSFLCSIVVSYFFYSQLFALFVSRILEVSQYHWLYGYLFVVVCFFLTELIAQLLFGKFFIDSVKAFMVYPFQSFVFYTFLYSISVVIVFIVGLLIFLPLLSLFLSIFL